MLRLISSLINVLGSTFAGCEGQVQIYVLPRHVLSKSIPLGHLLLPSFTLSLFLSFSAVVCPFLFPFTVLPVSEIQIPKSTGQKASQFCRHSTNKAIAYESLSSI